MTGQAVRQKGRAAATRIIGGSGTRPELGENHYEALSHVGHLLRTPLTIIVGYAEVLMTRETVPAAEQDFAREILLEAARLSRVIDELLRDAEENPAHYLISPDRLGRINAVSALEETALTGDAIAPDATDPHGPITA